MSKKILHLLATNKFSGAENVVCQIIKTFEADKEFEMVYCSPAGDISKMLEKKNIKHITLKKLNYSNLKKIIKEYKPDIIHAHDFRCSILAGLAKKKTKVISHIHCNPDFAKSWSIKSIIYNLVKNKFSKIVVVSKAIQEEAIFLKKSDKVCVIENCVNKEEILEKTKLYEIDKKYDVVCIGRLTEVKNTKMIIDIVEKILEKKKDLKVALIGDGEDREKIETYIKEKNLENVIELKGFLENPYPYLKNAKVSLMPSLVEGFGLVAIESMICGVPVLNSGVGGLATIFENEKYYICNDVEEYAKKATECILKNEKKSFEGVIKKYINTENMKTKLKEVYNQL